ncbi:MAG: AarF/ABC1/UbiB kinase family protein [Syntrophaceae bacterium]|nr:AarF/ABC1/UbiB kinase family protein [Syntrophaceae bacterium]
MSADNFTPHDMIDLSSPMLLQFLRNASKETLQEKLNTVAAAVGDEAFSRRVAREIVQSTRPQQAIPEVYGHYRSVLQDGITFFLSQVGRPRLIELVITQLKLNPEADTRERLLALAKQFPTLHKLGQIIARNPGTDPVLKKWLVHLENGCYGTPLEGMIERIGGELEKTGHRDQVNIRPVIISEASVGAVIPFQRNDPSSPEDVDGVFKILKPGIERKLEEELLILEKTAAFFEKNRSRYPLKDLKFLGIFQEIREMLVREIDLAAERDHLIEAARFFKGMERIEIPKIFPFSTGAITAMKYLNGPKITEASLTRDQRKHCAALLFDALVCRPLFSPDQNSLFHGDPHAGNILALKDTPSGPPRIGLVDWSQAGRLTKRDRVKIIQLTRAVYTKDMSNIRRAVKALDRSTSLASPTKRQEFRNLVLGMIQSPEFFRMTLIKRTFNLLKQLTFMGFVFPAELMLFRKAILTLQGVLYDLWPEFDMNAAVRQYLKSLMIREVPRRFCNLFLPLADRPENYWSLISNTDLQSLAVYQYIGAGRSGARSRARYH